MAAAPENPDQLQARLDAERTAYVEAQAAEYSTWVAAQDIQFNRVLAFVAGAPVPASTVERYGYDAAGLVKSAAEAAADREAAAEAARAAEQAAIEAHRREVAAAAEITPEPEPSAAEPTPSTAKNKPDTPTSAPADEKKD